MFLEGPPVVFFLTELTPRYSGLFPRGSRGVSAEAGQSQFSTLCEPTKSEKKTVFRVSEISG